MEAVKLCLEKAADVNAKNSMGVTAVIGAANRGSDGILEFLVKKGARFRCEGQGRPHTLELGGRRFPRHQRAPAKAQYDGVDSEADTQ